MDNTNPREYAGTISANNQVYKYQYRTLSVKRYPELQEDIDSLRRTNQLSSNEKFQGYIKEMKFVLPDDFQDARSVIIMAVFVQPMTVNFHFKDTNFPVAMLPGYYETGLTTEMQVEEIRKNIIPEPGYRVERAKRIHLKLLTVRSGLGQYGRNNISYVDGMGSFLSLSVYLTDYPFETDNWYELKMMDLCRNCTICMKQCPGGTIRADHFVVDIERCITLYNEDLGEFPNWIPADAHNAFAGCNKCQEPCPANRELLKNVGQFEDISEEETRQLVSGNFAENTLLSISQKLKNPDLVTSKELL